MLIAAAFLLQSVVYVSSVRELPTEPPHASNEIRGALASAEVNIKLAEYCAASRPRDRVRVEAVRVRFTAARDRARALYGQRITPPYGGIGTAVDCTDQHRSRYIRDARSALRLFDGAMRKRLSEMPGLWLGPFRLCRDTVESVDLVEDYDGSMQPLIRFAPAMRERLHAETKARIGLPMGVYLEGDMLFAPTVQEEMSTEIQFHGPGDVKQNQRIKAAAARPC